MLYCILTKTLRKFRVKISLSKKKMVTQAKKVVITKMG